ncbi:MAG: SH3 domain-containing protein [Chitinophagaceae bacterium]
MKKIFLLAAILVSAAALAQWPGDFYVASKGGLSLREKQDAGSRLLTTIPYGAKIKLSYPDESVPVTLEGMTGSWAKTTYGGKTGYVVNLYLLPWAVPVAATKTLKQYLARVSPAAGAAVNVKNGNPDLFEAGVTSMKKQIFRNGAEYHEEQFYESNNDSYFLPGFSMEQGFLLMRLIPEFSPVFDTKAPFPLESKKYQRNGKEYSLVVEKETLSETYTIITRIKVEYEDGVFYTFEMFLLGGQLVISFGGGV